MSTPNKAVLMVERWSCSHCGREGEVEYPSTVGCEESNELVARQTRQRGLRTATVATSCMGSTPKRVARQREERRYIE
jgi:hypothetical protein